MGFLELLTVLFIILKVAGVVSFSWWLVFLPTIVSLTIYAFMLVFSILGINSIRNKIK